MAMALFSSQFVKMHVSSKGKLGCLLGTVLDPLIRPQTWQTNNLVMGKLLNGMEAHTHTHISAMDFGISTSPRSLGYTNLHVVPEI